MKVSSLGVGSTRPHLEEERADGHERWRVRVLQQARRVLALPRQPPRADRHFAGIVHVLAPTLRTPPTLSSPAHTGTSSHVFASKPMKPAVYFTVMNRCCAGCNLQKDGQKTVGSAALPDLAPAPAPDRLARCTVAALLLAAGAARSGASRDVRTTCEPPAQTVR